MLQFDTMKFSELAKYIEEIEVTSSRLTITHKLAELFKKLHADEIDKTIYLLQGRIAPSFEKLEFGIAEKMINRSVIYALQLDESDFKKRFDKIGDVGKTVEEFKKEIHSFDEKDLSVTEVFNELHKLAEASGPGSQDLKMKILAHLFRQADHLSSRYLARIPAGTLRLGFSDMTVLDSLSWMSKGDKSLRPEIQGAYHVRPDLGYIAKVMKEKGIEGLHHVKPHIFTPILMMRAERLSSGKEIVEKIGESIIEPKYDGFRLQVHYSKKNHEVRLYSRNLEEVSPMYPDIVEGIKKEIKAAEIILEGEAIGYDQKHHKLLPFQLTVQRKRKYDIEEKAKEIPLKLFVFELLYADGVSYINEPFTKRREKLANVVNKNATARENTVILSPDNTTDDPMKLEALFDTAIADGLEGIIAKKMTGVYQPGARGWNWIKLKKSYAASSIKDTIDCLVMGYDFGKGKRAGFGIGAFLVGVYNEKKDMFVTIAKIGTGLSDEEWKNLKLRSDKYKSDKKPALYDVDKMMEVDVWVKPKTVVEIRADSISRSTIHTAGRIMKPSKSGAAFDVDVQGYALRFPRLEKFRDDKRPEDSTTLKELEKMFKMQK